MYIYNTPIIDDKIVITDEKEKWTGDEICIYVCMYVCMYIHVYIYIHICKYIFSGKMDLGGASEGNVDEDKSNVPILIAANTRIILNQGSNLIHTYTQESAASSRHIEVLSVDVLAEAAYNIAVVQMGGRISRANVHVDLKEVGANCSVNGVTLAQSRQSLDMHSSITHDSPACLSRQAQRNVIGDRGEAIFKGRIRIPQHAQLTDSDQLCRSIMLGDRARIIAMPTLEITADNIVCSHGASVADLDENSMFYLAARGIDRREARKLLLAAFMLELLDDHVMDKASILRMTKKVEAMNPASESRAKSDFKLVSM
jgi:Fe-S cluster assembly scaffold protein SufB